MIGRIPTRFLSSEGFANGPPHAALKPNDGSMCPRDDTPRRVHSYDRVMRNIKHAFRTLFRTPFVTIVAVLSLALGIGANAAIYSLFNQLLLQPLPVADPARLVNFDAPGPQIGSNSCNEQGGCSEVLSYPMFRDLEAAPTAFSGIAAHRLISANVAMPGQTPLNGEAMTVSGSYFSILGLHPTIGRLFTTNDDITIGGHPLAVLNYAFWETQLGSDPSVIGKPITVNGQQLTIIGVGPRGFNGTTVSARPFVYVPITMRAVLTPGFSKQMERRNNYWVYVFARLKPNTTIEGAEAAVNTVYNALVNERDVPLLKNVSAATMARFRAKKLKLSDGRRGRARRRSRRRRRCCSSSRSLASCCSSRARTSRICCSPAPRIARWKWRCGSRSAPFEASSSRNCSRNR